MSLLLARAYKSLASEQSNRLMVIITMPLVAAIEQELRLHEELI
jgi:hypothetical protein